MLAPVTPVVVAVPVLILPDAFVPAPVFVETVVRGVESIIVLLLKVPFGLFAALIAFV